MPLRSVILVRDGRILLARMNHRKESTDSESESESDMTRTRTLQRVCAERRRRGRGSWQEHNVDVVSGTSHRLVALKHSLR